MNRKLIPPFSQPKELPIIIPERIELQNGVELFWLKDVKDNAVKLDFEWSAGTKYQDKNLVSSFTNKLLMSGYEGKTAADIAEEIDFYGGFVQRELDKDHAGLTIFGLSENMSEVFNIVQHALLNCTFSEDEFIKEHAVTLSQFNIDSEKVKTICRREFNEGVFGKDTPYGKVASVKDFEDVNPSDLLAFYKKHYLGTQPTIFLVGQVDEDFIELLNQFSGEFKADLLNYEVAKLNQTKGLVRLEQVDKSMQAAIRMGRLAMKKNEPDYFQFQVLNTILGGYFGSRLMTNIREDKGYTYGIGSNVAVLSDAAYFFISTEVAAEFETQTLQEIENEFERLRTELVSEEELGRVKNYMLGNFLRQSDGSFAMMENFKNIYFNELDNDYYSNFIQAVHNTKPEDLRDLANKYLNQADLLTIVVC